jgi:hypothetical protein
MTSITNIQFSFASLQVTGQGALNGQEPCAGFDALLSRMSCEEDKESDKKKAGYAGSMLNVDFSAFGIGGEAKSREDLILGLIDDLFDKIRGAREGKSGGTGATQGNYAFPFSSAFDATFGGMGGPLYDFINETTARLGLSAEKNLALQNIAINNKDIVKTPDSVTKLAAELREAGIG